MPKLQGLVVTSYSVLKVGARAHLALPPYPCEQKSDILKSAAVQLGAGWMETLECLSPKS